MKLKWFHCSHEHYGGIGKFDVFILGDSTEHLFFSVEFAKPFGSTTFFPCKCQYGSEFSQIGTPHFSLEGVIFFSLFFFLFPALIFAYMLMTHKYLLHVFRLSTNPPKKSLTKRKKKAGRNEMKVNDRKTQWVNLISFIQSQFEFLSPLL